MLTILGARPNPYNLLLLKQEAHAAWPQHVIDVNEVGDDICFYFPDGSPVTEGEVTTLLNAHDGTQMSQKELAEQAKLARIADAHAALPDLDDGKASKGVVQGILATIVRYLFGEQ